MRTTTIRIERNVSKEIAILAKECNLTQREKEVLHELAINGFSNIKLAEHFHILEHLLYPMWNKPQNLSFTEIFHVMFKSAITPLFFHGKGGNYTTYSGNDSKKVRATAS